jgi:prepilin-type N-terminal cleavage/methylation domain-containing protein
LRQVIRGFTLIELLIVILIIGIVYALFVSGFDTRAKVTPLRFEELKTTLLTLSKNRPVRVECRGEACETCRIIQEGQEEREIVLFHEKPHVFAYDRHGYLKEKRYADERCFDFTIRANLSSDTILVEREGKYYLFYAYLAPTAVFEEYDRAAAAFDPAGQILLDTNEYYNARQ